MGTQRRIETISEEEHDSSKGDDGLQSRERARFDSQIMRYDSGRQNRRRKKTDA